MRGHARPAGTALLLAILASGLASLAVAQFRGGRYGMRLQTNPPYDGAFQSCRGMYRRHPQGDGGGWTTDYPQADENLPFRFAELTKAAVSRDEQGRFNHQIVALTDPGLFKCPILIMQEVGALYSDAFEREGEDRSYFDRFAGLGYSFGINVLIYAMTH